MSHEITLHDNIALYKEPAWHGIGEVISSEMSPTEAMGKAGMDWEVAAVKPSWAFGDVVAEAASCQSVLRIPRPGAVDRAGRPERIIELGTVGPDWKPIQNREMFALAEAGAGLGVKVESAGSLSEGRVVFVLLRADSFLVGDADQVHKYLMLVMSHTGDLTLRAVPTSVRVVCNNTMRMALRKAGFFAIRHTGDIQAKLAEMTKAIQYFRMSGVEFEDRVQKLHARKLRTQELKNFFTEAWVALHGEANPENDSPRKAAKAQETIADWQTGMELEQIELGEKDVSLWLALNSVTRWIQHRAPGKTPADVRVAADVRLRKNLVGWNDRDTTAMLRLATKSLAAGALA